MILGLTAEFFFCAPSLVYYTFLRAGLDFVTYNNLCILPFKKVYCLKSKVNFAVIFVRPSCRL